VTAVGDVLGLHLLQHLDQIGSPRRSVLARLDGDGRLADLATAAGDDEVVALTASTPGGAVVVDAPLAVPTATGRRDVEAVLAWCDVTAFPVSGRRLAQVTGGARGAALAPALARPGRWVAEGLPDLVLRQIAWERDHPAGDPALDLAEYRAAWIGVRAPAYRPKGAGRARPAGIAAAWALLAGVVDLGGWTPAADGGDDWRAIADAAAIDAVCCAYAALRVERGEGVLVGTPERGRVAVPVDANLRGRLDLTLTRLRGEGTIGI
jgi:predicted nuclease with RNAse H fold